jgi:ribosomal protein S18 acetylase RimI-like enzyme
MIVSDWRERADGLDEAYQIEARRARSLLHWDTEPNWRIVETARSKGHLPGRIVRDVHGRWHGWTFFLLHEGALQIGAFSSDSEAATDALVHDVLRSPEAARARRVMLFGFVAAPGLAERLRAEGFTVEPYLYLSARLGGRGADHAGLQTWGPDDVGDAAELLSAAYPGADPMRPFASEGRITEWVEYVRTLVEAEGCGRFLPQTTVTARHQVGRLDGLALVTQLDRDTAHLAQMAVRPEAQGRGLARRLLASARTRARREGCERMTLLVSTGNAPARALYDSLGFTLRAEFLSAARINPRG